MKKDRKDILKELREEVILAKSMGNVLDISSIIVSHLEDITDSIEPDEMAAFWIYGRVATEANSRNMYSVGAKNFADPRSVTEEQLVFMLANQIERKINAEKTLDTIIDSADISFNWERGHIESGVEKKARLLHEAYEEVARRKAQ